MNTYIQAASVLLPLAYLVATVLFGTAFAGPKAPPIARRWRPRALVAAIVLHATLFAAHWSVAGTFPVAGAWMSVSAAAGTVAALYACLALRVSQHAVGAIVLAVVTVMQTCSSAFGPVRAEPLPPVTGPTAVHVVTVVLAAAAVVLSGVFGYLHVLMYRQLRGKRFGSLFRELPDLEQLARLMRRAALAGFLFLTAGLNVGIGLAHARGVAGFRYTDPHVLLTMAVWVHFGLIAFSRRIRGLSARRTSFAAVAGLVALLLAILITLLPSATFHRLG